MEYLHQEIKIEIFSRLCVESVIKCRQVCKSWNALLRLPYFVDMHLNHQLLQKVDHSQPNRNHCTTAGKVGFLCLASEKSSLLCYLEYDESERSYTTLKFINHPPVKKQGYKIAMVGSCNGLVCFSVPSPRGIDDPVYICNPLTNECTYLPKFNILRDYKGLLIDKKSSYGGGRMASGFGYHPSTKEYKIVRVIYYDVHKVGRVQVYTLGSGTGWVNKGEITYLLVNRIMIIPVSQGILVNGALYWIDYRDWGIVGFDLATEQWSSIPSPRFSDLDEDHKFYQLRELGGCLSALGICDNAITICSFKKSGQWENVFSIPYYTSNMVAEANWPVTLTMEGKVLFRRDNSLRHYDPKSETSEKTDEKFEDVGTDLRFSEGIRHTNSFVSLKALGEICRTIR